VLWEFNRFLPEKPCQTGILLETLLLRLIDVEVLATICVILPPAPSVLQEGSSDACVYTRGSVRRASGFVLTGKPEFGRATPVRTLIGGKEAIDHEAELAPSATLRVENWSRSSSFWATCQCKPQNATWVANSEFNPQSMIGSASSPSFELGLRHGRLADKRLAGVTPASLDGRHRRRCGGRDNGSGSSASPEHGIQAVLGWREQRRELECVPQ
jgi:hypothetical protein